jgi:hypothetical protein
MQRGLGRFLLRVVLPLVAVLGAVNLASRGVDFDFDAWLDRNSVIEILGSLIGFVVALVCALLATVGAGGLLVQTFERNRGRGFVSRVGSFVGAVFVGLLALVLIAGLAGTVRDALRRPEPSAGQP